MFSLVCFFETDLSTVYFKFHADIGNFYYKIKLNC